MPRKKKEFVDEIEEKIEYLGIDLNNISENLKRFEPIEYKVTRFYDEKQYRQYRYINVKDIQILLSPTNRLTDLEERYKKASPLADYLDKYNEKNLLKYSTFLKMLKETSIEDIEKIEQEQMNLNRKIPFKVKYENNYLWQIYYSENTGTYFMLVPTEETNYSTFFYLLKKKNENKGNCKIFVPISNIKYSNKFYKQVQFEEIENNLWLFTKDWPLIYEVYDKNDNMTIQIIGETQIYENIKTDYKVEIRNEQEALEFYKLLKALFILQTSLPNYYKFDTNIDKDGRLTFLFEGKRIEYLNLITFIREQFVEGLKKKKEIKIKIKEYNRKLEKLQNLSVQQEIEYLAKEKQISTFLECKKSFFGKVKYFFKYSKKTKNNKKEQQKSRDEEIAELVKDNNQIKNEIKEESKKEKNKILIKKVYTLDELITNFKELEELETKMKNIVMDLNSLKLKTKNLAKKIENATKYIEEIDSHKRSIFEFWKYSNKDEMSSLPEGEEVVTEGVMKISKTFCYEEDFEEFGKKLDMLQRQILTKEDTDMIYIATTKLLDVLNKTKTNNLSPDELEKVLKELKSLAKNSKSLNEEEYDIFGNLIENSTRLKKIKNVSHRELPKDEFAIMEIDKDTKLIGFKLTVQMVIQNIMKALELSTIPDNLPVYKAIYDNTLNNREINVFNVNPENEIKEILKKDGEKINLYKVNIKEGTKGVGFTNIIFYDNQNKTLPIGMDLSTKLIVDISKLHLRLVNQKKFNVAKFSGNGDFATVNVKEIVLSEYEIVDIEDLK